MAIKRSDIESLEMEDERKNELLSLFDTLDEKESEIQSLRKKLPTDSQKVVDSVDYEKFTAATAELERLKAQIAESLNRPPVNQLPENNEPSGPFACFGI